jgi:hypothetical protein
MVSEMRLILSKKPSKRAFADIHSPLGKTPHKARKKLDALVRAAVALCKASAERCGSTGADVPEYFALLSGQSMSPSGKELLLMLAKDIGHFQPMTRHESCW